MSANRSPHAETFDVLVVGGGPAGLNGALMLARSRRSVVVVDAGFPRNARAEGVHGLLGHDGLPPAELLKRGRDEVRRYGGHLKTGEVTRLTREDGLFVAAIDDAGWVKARRVLVTTGLADTLPDIAGMEARWGHDVLHCPYCHGWEVRDKAIGVLASGSNSVHQALLFRQLSDDVLYLSHTWPPSEDEVAQLTARGIPIVQGEVTALEVAKDQLTGVRLASGELVRRAALVVSPRTLALARFLDDLGLEPAEHPSGLGQSILVDASWATTVPGVWAAGNATDPTAQVGTSAAAGAMAGIRINADLVAEDTRVAMEAMSGRG